MAWGRTTTNPPGIRVNSWPTISLPEGALAVGDLHLDVFDLERPRLFREWCEGLRATHLLILGDLFEFWVGRHQLGLPGTAEVVLGLQGLVERGVGVDVLHGNRDYLLGAPFEAASGARVFPQGVRCVATDEQEHSGEGTLFLHGDELCSADRSYQLLKAVLRSRPMRALQRGLPLRVQLRLARSLRRASVRGTSAKAKQKVQMVPETAAGLASSSVSQTLICGHAHRWREECAETLRWIVLDAWGGDRDAVQLRAGRWEGASSGIELTPAPIR
jgi:UDP-2,3-diacylglucosamine hydrolase